MRRSHKNQTITEAEKKSLENFNLNGTAPVADPEKDETMGEDDVKISVAGQSKKVIITPTTFNVETPAERFLFTKAGDSELFAESECTKCSDLNNATMTALSSIFDDLECVTTWFDTTVMRTKTRLVFRLRPDEVYMKSAIYDGENDKRAILPIISKKSLEKREGIANNIYAKYIEQSIQTKQVQGNSDNANSYIKISPYAMKNLTNYLLRNQNIEKAYGNAYWVPKLDYEAKFVCSTNIYGQGSYTNINVAIDLDAEKVVKSLCECKKEPANKYQYQVLYYAFNPNNQDALIEIKRYNRRIVDKIIKTDGVKFLEVDRLIN